MSEPLAPHINTDEVWVEHQQGRIFTQWWMLSKDKASDKKNTPIVLFHDSLGCVDLWRDFPAELCMATGHPVIAYDRLGFGRSDPREDKLEVDFIADEARSYFPVIRKQLGLRSFMLFGHSVGGGMAVNCAAEFATDCAALITVAAQVFPEDRTLQSISLAKEQFKDPKQIKRLEKYHGEKAKWVLDAWTDSWLHPDFAAWSLEPVLPRVTSPVLAIHGIHDEYGSTRHPEMIGQLCEGRSRVEIIPDTYHVPHRERPELIVNLVSEFIDRDLQRR